MKTIEEINQDIKKNCPDVVISTTTFEKDPNGGKWIAVTVVHDRGTKL